MNRLKAVADFAQQAFKAEFLTPPGVINIVGLFAAFVLVAGVGLTDLWQALVRTWDDSYTSGAPSLLVLLLVFGGILLACVAIVGLLSPSKR